MIRRIGVDVVSVPRVSALIQRYGGRFLHRWFTAAEISEAEATDLPDRHFAVCLAAKEAVFKSLGLDGRRTVPWRHIEVLGLGTGTVKVGLYGPLTPLRNDIERFVISSSAAGVAIAFVIAIAIAGNCQGPENSNVASDLTSTVLADFSVLRGRGWSPESWQSRVGGVVGR